MDEVTGLHAFDHLDPVSALNVLPEEPEPVAQPQRSQAVRHAEARPPAPAFRGRSLPPPPPPRGGPAGMSVPPPPPMRSFAPPVVGPGDLPPPRLGQPIRPVASPSSPSWASARATASAARGSQPPAADDDLTQRVQFSQIARNHLAQNGDLDESDPTSLFSIGQGGDVEPMRGPDGMMDYSATSVATSIDMDWDEDEEPQTNMRDELQSARASSMDFDPVVHVPATAPASYMPPANAAARPSLMPSSGQPSPFVRASLPVAPPQSWEDDAETRIHNPVYENPVTEVAADMNSAPWARAGSSTVDTMLPDEDQPSKLRGGLPWMALAGVLAVGLALGVRAMMAPPALATVTLVTQPADAQVSVDGRPLVGQTSPFTIQGLAPDSEHSLIVRSEGHAEHSSRFRVEPGETKSLSTVELTPVRVDTGFALTSQPEGAAVFVDGQPLNKTTPIRIADLTPGLHTVRLDRGEGFLPWETQVAIAAGQMIDLSPAQLAPASAAKQASSGSSGGSEQARLERKQRRAERRAEREAAAEAAAEAKRAARAAKAAPKVASAKPAKLPAAAKPAPVVAGGGTLRVNSRPWAQVFVDGKLVGNTPQMAISLSPGSHKLKLVSPDLGLTKQMTVQVEKGKATTKVVNLIE
jgi:hypothetical protein